MVMNMMNIMMNIAPMFFFSVIGAIQIRYDDDSLIMVFYTAYLARWPYLVIYYCNCSSIDTRQVKLL